ncbi:hypothetical protein AB205_0078510 [Aquarana catesbeiana]|uniref:Uncharacterized protein n=1 Tax=Aquarana catesbeiana TaxID=8400 RepID=A0A2G9SK92_AQUCT|nr:hypothetical protein AB205_0078510 [Aquarana catesbeiana]
MFHIPISCLKYLCAKYTLFFIHIGEKILGTSEDTENTTPPKEGEIPTHPEEDVEGGEVQELGEIVTTTGQCLRPQLQVIDVSMHIYNAWCVFLFFGDVDVGEEETNFTSASAQILIGEIMF